MGWRDRVGCGDNKGGGSCGQTSWEPWGAPCKLLVNPRTPRGDAVIWARLSGNEQSHPSLCPSSGSAFLGAEDSAAALALGCHHLLTVLSADPLSSCHLSHSFASLLSPQDRWKWQRGGNGEKPVPAVLLLHLPGCPREVQVPPVSHWVLLMLHGIALGLS